MTSTVVAIPVRDRLEEFTKPLVAHLLTAESVDHVLVMDNGSEDGTPGWLRDAWRRDARLVVEELPDRSIYALWNYAFQFARGVKAGEQAETVNLALLNNDVTLLPGTLGRLSDALRATPDFWAVSVNPDRRIEEGFGPPRLRNVRGSYRHGGLCGWAFMAAVEKWGDIPTPVDEGFEWWFGDDDLAFSITDHGGRIGREMGVPCDHVSEGTARLHPWTQEAKGRDWERFRRKWGNV